MVHLAIITKSASTKSGARAPLELARHLQKLCHVTVFAQKNHSKKPFTGRNIKLILYKNSLHLFKLLKNMAPDVISFHATLTEMLAAKLTGIPIVKTYYGTQLDAYLERFLPEEKPGSIAQMVNSLANGIIWLNQKIQLMLANKVIAISKYTQQELERLYKTPSTLIYLATDATRFDAAKSTLGEKTTSKQSTIILSVSRLTPYKGFHLILDVAKRLRAKGLKIKVIIAGSTQNQKYLDYLKEIKDPNDRILTNIEDESLAKLYSSCDVYASCDRYPFFGLPLLEAALASKPTAALKFAAAEEIVLEGKTGYLANSQSQFTDYLELLILNPDKRHKMGNLAKVICQKKFDKEKIASSYTRIFQKFAKHKKTKSVP